LLAVPLFNPPSSSLSQRPLFPPLPTTLLILLITLIPFLNTRSTVTLFPPGERRPVFFFVEDADYAHTYLKRLDDGLRGCVGWKGRGDTGLVSSDE
jgi:hypothetical protein